MTRQVTDGGGGMPAFGKSLSKAQITAVAKYVSSVAGEVAPRSGRYSARATTHDDGRQAEDDDRGEEPAKGAGLGTQRVAQHRACPHST